MSDSTIMVLLAACAVILGVLLLRTLRAGQGAAPSSRRSSARRPTAASDGQRAQRSAAAARKEGDVEVEIAEVEASELDSVELEAAELEAAELEALAVPSAVREDRDIELTKLSLATLERDEQTAEWRPSKKQAVVPIVYDDEAAVDEPTQPSAFILVSAVGQTDQGRRRRRNEDSYLILDDPPLFVVADGMGGYAGGDVASGLAVEAIAEAFAERAFEDLYEGLPRRGSELVQAIQHANQRIFAAAQADEKLREMGTTLVCARFSANKQRVYIGHVGDSRCYVARGGVLHQITTDHTAANEGVTGPLGATLTRALGIGEGVMVDLILAKPRAGDLYVLCSDGLSKMVPDEEIEALVMTHNEPAETVKALIDAANEHGGKDNVTVVLVRVEALSPSLMPPPT